MVNLEALTVKQMQDAQIAEMNRMAKRWAEEQLWLKEHRQEYVGEWVALNGSNLLSHSTNAKEVFDMAKLFSIDAPLVVRVEQLDDVPFAGW